MKTLLFAIAALFALNTSPVSAVQKDVIDRAQAVFTEQLELNCTPGAEPEWIAEDAVYQYVLSSINVKLRVEGRAAIAEHLCAISESSISAQVQNIRYFPTLDQNVVYVQYDLVPVNGVAKGVSPLAIIEMRDNQIVNFTQLSRSAQSLKVLQAVTGGVN